MSVSDRRDLSHLISGDLVVVWLEQNFAPDEPKIERWMVYAGQSLNEYGASMVCRFIDLPQTYKGGHLDSFLVWESSAKDLEFPDMSVCLTARHRLMRTVGKENPLYETVQAAAVYSLQASR